MAKTVIFDPITKKFTQLENPVKLRLLEVVLTEEEQHRVIAEFKDIFGREPVQEEIEELFIEERKLKRERR